MRKTQRQVVLDYLKENGSISHLESVLELGIIELPKRICELQDDGYRFRREKKSKISKYGRKVNYLVYHLIDEIVDN